MNEFCNLDYISIYYGLVSLMSMNNTSVQE